MIKHGEINPLNVFGLRQMGHCPPHFEKVTFDRSTSEKNIINWIYENLSGRFWYGYIGSANHRDGVVTNCVAFEVKSEASYFTLMLDTFNQYDHGF